MGNRAALKMYDFTLTAGGSMNILVESDNFRIMSCIGPVDVIGDTFGTLPGVQAGQGLQNTPYKRLTLRDASGAPNSGTILCSGDLFVDNRTIGQVSLTGEQSGFTQAQGNIGIASGQVLAAKANRRYFLFQNNDAAAIVYITLDGTAATAAKGIKLNPGDSFELNGFASSAQINAIASVATTAVVVVEG